MSQEKTKTVGIYYKDTIYLERLSGVRDLSRAAKSSLFYLYIKKQTRNIIKLMSLVMSIK